MYFLKKFPNSSGIRAESIHLYRLCMRVIKKLDHSHQKICKFSYDFITDFLLTNDYTQGYDYTRLKYEEYRDQKDPIKLKAAIKDAHEQIEWLQSVLARKGV